MPLVPATRKPVEVEATGLDDAGHGVGLVGGRTVHVADLCPGERAEIALVHASPHQPADWGRIVRRLGELSGDRTTPACPAFGRCGGCVWQHVRYPAQLLHKRARVIRALDGAMANLATADRTAVAPVVPSATELGYRHKGKYVAGWLGGRLVLGAWGPRSHALIDTAGCRVVAPLVDDLRERARAAAEAAGLPPWDERRRTGALRYVIVRASRAGRGLVVLVVRSDTPAAAVLAVAQLIARDPRVAGVVRVDNDRDDGALLDEPAQIVVGDGSVRDLIAGVEVELGAGAFAQINPTQADAMYARVAALAGLGASDRAADVYAGLGGISFALAHAGARVVAIERDASAVTALAAAANRAGLGARVEARVGDATTLRDAGEVAVVVVNPPRKGLAPDVIAAVLGGEARRVIYVSCGPESLGRDLALLINGGYTVDAIEPFDLMPGTSQVETVVRLQR